MVPVPRLFDIVVTTNSGYPLDLNLYQSVKGLRAADPIVRPGGAIIIATRCSDGIPEHGLYGRLLRESASPEELLDKICAPGFLEQDQWQAHVQALIQQKVGVFVRSDGLTDDEIRAALLRVLGAIAPEADLGHLAPDADLREELDLDSMDILNVAVGLHEALGVDIPEIDYPRLATLRSAVAYLATR
jgi:acyl carrier protein